MAEMLRLVEDVAALQLMLLGWWGDLCSSDLGVRACLCQCEFNLTFRGSLTLFLIIY